MQTNYFKLIATLFVLSILIVACKKTEEENSDDNSNDIIKEYSGSGSEGDLITFSINQTNNTYTIHNETTGVDENGNYSILSDNNMQGIYHVSNGENNFYAVELDDKIIAANFPTGNPNNNISFGVSSNIDNTANTNHIAGNYVYIIMDNNGVMNNPATKEWGLLNIKNDHTWIKQEYASNTGDGSMTEMSPEDYTGMLPITTGDESGTWVVDETHKERLNITIDGTSISLAGYVYADSETSAFLLDLGTGNGFLIGLRVTNNSNFSTISGDYKYVNVWDNGYGAGNYSINNTGQVTWNHQGNDGASSGSFQLTQCSNAFTNIYYCNNAEMETGYFEKIYCVIVGDVILHFSFDNSNGNFAQYGAGAKL